MSKEINQPGKDYFEEYLLMKALVEQQKKVIALQDLELEKFAEKTNQLQKALNTYAGLFRIDKGKMLSTAKLIRRNETLQKQVRELHLQVQKLSKNQVQLAK